MSQVAKITVVEGADKMFKTGKVANIFKLLEQTAQLMATGGSCLDLGDEETLEVRRGAHGKLGVFLKTGEPTIMLGIGISADGKSLEICAEDKGPYTLMVWSYKKILGGATQATADTRSSVEERAEQAGGPSMPAEAELLEQVIGIEAHHNSDIKTEFDRHGVKAALTWATRAGLERATALANEGKLIDDVIEVVARNIREFPGAPRSLRIALCCDVAGLVPDVVVFGHSTDLYRIDIANNDLNLVTRNFAVGGGMPAIIISDVTINDSAPLAMVRLPENEVTSFSQQAVGMKFEALILNADLEAVIGYYGPEELDRIVTMVVNQVSHTPDVTMKWVDTINVRLVESQAAQLVVVEVVKQGTSPTYVGDLYSVNVGNLLVEDHDVAFAMHRGWTIQLSRFRATAHTELLSRMHRPHLHVDRDFGRGRELGDYERLGPAGGDEPVKPVHKKEDVRIPTREWIPQIKQFVHIEGDSTLYFIADYDQLEHMFLLQQADSARRERNARYDSRHRDSRINADGLIPVEPGRLRPFVLFH